MNGMLVCVAGRWGYGGPGPSCPWPCSLSRGPWGGIDGGQACVLHESTGAVRVRSLSGGGRWGSPACVGHLGEEARQELCTEEKLAGGQAG